MPQDRAPLALFGMLATSLGFSLLLLGRFIRETDMNRAELCKCVAEQEERIRILEKQVAALSVSSSTTHDYAA
jgi:hypothetical protein